MRISVIFLMTLPKGSTSSRRPVMPTTATTESLNTTGTLMPRLAPLYSWSSSVEMVCLVRIARRAPSWLVPMRLRSVLAMIVPAVSNRLISWLMMPLRLVTIVSAIWGSRSMDLLPASCLTWYAEHRCAVSGAENCAVEYGKPTPRP